MNDITPFQRSWWVTSSELLAGCCPGPFGAAPNEATLEALYNAGVRTIISLIPEDERDKTGALRRSYLSDWQRVGSNNGEPVHWLRCPIPDMGIPSPEAMLHLIQEINNAPRIVYIHCWGGSGRTGTVAGCYLTSLGKCPDEALDIIHRARHYSPQLAEKASPQMDEQRAFIHEFAEFIRH